jgi:hypothetical protein
MRKPVARSNEIRSELTTDQAPVDHVVAEQRVDVLEAGVRTGPVEVQVGPVADAREQVEPHCCPRTSEDIRPDQQL